ncbi:hypothetical protein IAR55_004354 [Kwoniella newhampshirensis]|uniref:NADH:ubiquinone oxidoreductase intermediate-associated protein 30 domain-containing protein n=1 Tax=Kwoniella newhampshirensis TaxID=1651941 RepID=A0AAW0YPB8_9TREE
MASPLKSYFGRSIDLLRKSTAAVVKMDATPVAVPQTIFSFDTAPPQVDDPSHFGLGSDSEIGGLSTCQLALIPSTSTSVSSGTASGTASGSGSASSSHMAFYGYMTTKVPPSHAGKIRTGYAGFRNTSRSTLFGQDNWDLDLYTHLRVVVGYRGWEGWRNRWVVNIGIDGRPKSDVFQHRLELPPSPLSTSSKLPLDPSSPPAPSFTTLHLPLSSFVLIKKGHIAPSPIPMPRTNVRTVGFALLGRDRDDVASTAMDASANKSLLRIGGWGKAGTSTEEVENDPELKQLLEEDNLLVAEPTPTSSSPSSSMSRAGPSVRRTSATGGYHRVGNGASTVAASPAPTAVKVPSIPGESAGNVVATDDREGYYELCIKSVEAVKWDAEMDGSEEAEV